MSFDSIQPVRFFTGIIKFFGLWRVGNRWELLYLIYSFLLHCIFTFLNIVTMCISIFTAEDLEQFTESLYMSLTEAAFLAKFINLIYFKSQAIEFIELLQCPEVTPRSSEEKQIFTKAHHTFGVVGKTYVFMCFLSIPLVFTVAAFGSKNALPYPAWMPFQLNPGKFWYAFIFQLIGLCVTCLCNVSIDVLQCYFMHHLSLLYTMIGYRLSRIGFDIEDQYSEAEVNRRITADLKETIRMHLFVKKLTTKCERLTSVPNFMQLLLSALVLCFTGFQLQEISPLEKTGKFIGIADLLVALSVQIFLPCFYAERVTISSGKLSEALYSSNWVALPQKSKKLICLYMEFLRDPVCIKAGVFFNVGIPIFAKTINNAYSYFAVLIKMKN